MTMFTLPNFCRVCLKYDKNLIDLEHIENEPSETLMSKLQHCVSEVEWKVFKPLLCHPCIKRLNIAYTFKKQCVQSASMLKSYVALVKDTKKKNESENANSEVGQPNTYVMLPNQKYIKIVVGPQSQNTFQNVFLNMVPTASLSPLPPDNNKDSNQNVFLNINNTFQKYIPLGSVEPVQQKENNVNVSQLLTESKSEELSVEIDPTDFGLGDDGESTDNDEDCENSMKDWEDVISSNQIASRSNGANLNGQKSETVAKSSSYGNFVPILPKQQSSEDKMEFFNSGQHFLSSQIYQPDYQCEKCQKHFSSTLLLKNHIKDFHLGKFPFKCDYCYNEFLLRAEYETCMKYHKPQTESSKTSLTLNDFSNSPDMEKGATTETEPTQQELADLVCEICHRQFNSTSGLLRHKVRKHNQKTKKKYFIKGMKNAKCDICNREFSTQSYMQLHRKLHLRDDFGYKYKVFGKNRYVRATEQSNNGKTDNRKDNSESDELESDQKSDNQNNTSNNHEMDNDNIKIENSDKSKMEEDEDEDDESDEEHGFLRLDA